MHVIWFLQLFWLVFSTNLKNISQIGSFLQVGVKIKNIWNHHLVLFINKVYTICFYVTHLAPLKISYGQSTSAMVSFFFEISNDSKGRLQGAGQTNISPYQDVGWETILSFWEEGKPLLVF